MATTPAKKTAAKKSGGKKAQSSKGGSVTIEFAVDRDTKTTRRFAEVTEGEYDEPVIGSLYVKKSKLADLNGGSMPDTLTVTISV